MSSRDNLTHADKAVAGDPWDARATREERFIDLLKKRHPQIEVRDLSPTIDALRAVKGPREIDLCREAGRLSALAINEAIRSTAPGVCEYQLAALADYVYLVHGARGEDCPLNDGALVLMDAAPDYH